MLPARGGFGGARDARNYSRPSIRQGRAGEDHGTGKFGRRARIVDGGGGTRVAIARAALSRDRIVHRRSRVRLGEDLRPGGLVAGAGGGSRSVELFEV